MRSIGGGRVRVGAFGIDFFFRLDTARRPDTCLRKSSITLMENSYNITHSFHHSRVSTTHGSRGSLSNIVTIVLYNASKSNTPSYEPHWLIDESAMYACL